MGALALSQKSGLAMIEDRWCRLMMAFLFGLERRTQTTDHAGGVLAFSTPEETASSPVI
jgi:hypothetical protein